VPRWLTRSHSAPFRQFRAEPSVSLLRTRTPQPMAAHRIRGSLRATRAGTDYISFVIQAGDSNVNVSNSLPQISVASGSTVSGFALFSATVQPCSPRPRRSTPLATSQGRLTIKGCCGVNCPPSPTLPPDGYSERVAGQNWSFDERRNRRPRIFSAPTSADLRPSARSLKLRSLPARAERACAARMPDASPAQPEFWNQRYTDACTRGTSEPRRPR
jgi:hypothetical protein